MTGSVTRSGFRGRIDRSQRIALLAGGALAAGSVLFPPWQFTSDGLSWFVEEGYAFLMTPPTQTGYFRIDVSTLLVQLVAIAVGTVIAVVTLAVLKGKRPART